MRPLTTPRLHIRSFTMDDLDAVVQVQDECFGEAPRAEREQWLAWAVRNEVALERLKQPPYGDYAVTLIDSGQVIGAVGLAPSFGPFERLPVFRSRLREEPGRRFTPEMGLFWAIAIEHRRKGYASEAAGALARFAFAELNADRLVATTEHSNAASIGVMRRLGMNIQSNPDAEPEWFQTVGVLFNASHATYSNSDIADAP